MDELNELIDFAKKYKEQPPSTRRYPKEFWIRAMKLSEEIGAKEVARKLGISYGNLARRISLANKPKISKKTKNAETHVSFVEVPLAKSKKQIILELPHNIFLRIDL